MTRSLTTPKSRTWAKAKKGGAGLVASYNLRRSEAEEVASRMQAANEKQRQAREPRPVTIRRFSWEDE